MVGNRDQNSAERENINGERKLDDIEKGWYRLYLFLWQR